jgi:hypothetical protein
LYHSIGIAKEASRVEKNKEKEKNKVKKNYTLDDVSEVSSGFE